MTTIHKLSILGVRSFSEESLQNIDFDPPLTIITGHNGSGKTSIIESLKYACTGSQPPLSDNGKSFVHDPKLAGKPTVKAQIRVQFTAIDGNPARIVRSFQVSHKKNGKQEFKALESVVRTINSEGDVVSISKRCAEVEKQVPRMLGVSSAVLENVIFCHQEDSNWPLQDSRHLKDKFDDIFDSSRYTKALDSINKTRKEHVKKLKGMQSELGMLALCMETAEKLQRDLERTKKSLGSRREKCTALEEKMDEYNVNLAMLNSKSHMRTEISRKITKLAAKKKVLTKEKEKAWAKCPEEFDESDAQLQGFVAKEQEQTKQVTALLERKTKELISTEQRWKAKRFEHESSLQMMGKIQAQAEFFMQKLANCRTHIDEMLQINVSIAVDVQVPSVDEAVGGGAAASDAVVDQFLEFGVVFNQKVTVTKEADLRGYQKNRSIYLGKLRDGRDKVGHAADELTKQVTVQNTLIEERNVKLGEYQLALSKLNSSDGNAGNLMLQIENAEEALNAFTELGEYASTGESIDKKTQELRQANELMNTLLVKQQKLATSKDATSAEAMRDKCAAVCEEISLALATLCETNPVLRGAEGLVLEFDRDSDELDRRIETLGTDMKLRQTDLQLSLTQEEKRRVHKASELRKAEIQRDVLRHCIAELEKKKRAHENAVEEFESENTHEKARSSAAVLLAEKKAVAAAVRKLENSLLKTVTQVKTFKSNIKAAQEDDSCPTCERTLNTAQVTKLVEDKTELVETFESKSIRPKQAELEKQQQVLDALTELHERRVVYEKAQVDLAHVAAALSEAHDDLGSVDSAVERNQPGDGSREQHLMLACDHLGVALTLLVQHEDFFGEYMEKVGGKQSKRSPKKKKPGVAEVKKEITANKKKITSLNKDIDNLRKLQLKLQDDKEKLANTLSMCRTEALRSAQSEGEISKLQSRISDLKLENAKSETAINDDRVKLAPLQQQRQSKSEQLSIEEKKFKEFVAAAKEEIMTHKALLEKLRAMCRELRTMIEEQNKMGVLKRSQEAAQTAVQELEVKLKQLKAEIDNYKAQLVSMQDMGRNARHNLDHRARKRELVGIERELEEYQEELKHVGGEEVFTQIEELQKQRGESHTELAELRGASRVESDSVKDLESDLRSTKFKNIVQRHKRMLVESKTTNMAVNDLEIYGKALDEALMKFHASRMKDINQILAEYWTETYQGNDIDMVYIKSEAATTSGVRRTYNYRVVMKQGDVELNMRGRCSAGQKVLASILIRLALAETFCLQCGIMTLDEPTTNLDKANIMSLARALSNIIEKRRVQKNFQLIVITHDEEFVNQLGSRAHTDYYYRVGKDPATLCSKVQKVMV